MAAPHLLAILLYFLLALVPLKALAGHSRFVVSADPLIRGLDFASKRYPEEAVAEFSKCKTLAPATASQLTVIAKTYSDTGDVSSALKTISYALSQERVKREKGEMSALLELRGRDLAYLNKPDEATSSYKQAAQACPGLSYIYLAKAGQELMKSKKYTEALPLLEKGIKAGNMNGFVYQDIGRCYLGISDPAKAIAPLLASIDAFEAVRKKKPDAFLPGLVRSQKYLVKAYQGTSNKKEALRWQKRLDTMIGDFNDALFGSR